MHTTQRRIFRLTPQTDSRGAAITDRTYDPGTWLETYKETVASFSSQLSEKLRARAQEFSTLAADVQESVGTFAAEAASRAAGTKKAA